ncbi:MAG: restriction endonuclease subunit S [Ruminococcus sp.]|nr:restriction endonuclease subunit S [Ruminococcus sp.]
MKSEWKECTIADLGEVVGGATPSTKKSENYENGTISWITPKDLSKFHDRYIYHGERNITKIGLKSCSAKMLPKNTILFSSRAPIGYLAIAGTELCTNQGFKSVIPNANTDFLFLYYLLKFHKQNIEHMGSGTTFKEVSGNTMKSIKVSVPVDISEQHKIAIILSAIDDKIELNNKINQNLEQQAQAIFKSWFINYKPNGILSDIANITMGQSPKGTSYNNEGIGTIFFQGKTDFGNRFPTVRVYTTEPKKVAQSGDILISVRAPVGDLNITNQKCCIGRGLASIRSKNNNQSFLFYTLLNIKSQLDIFNSQGTVFGAINQKSLKDLSIIIPPYKIVEKFEKVVSPIDEMIKINEVENQKLSALRDLLLSKLINGEIDVSKIKI